MDDDSDQYKGIFGNLIPYLIKIKLNTGSKVFTQGEK